MTIEELLQRVGMHPLALVVLLALAPAVSAMVGLLHGRGGGGASPWKYLHSALVYAACIPGMFAVVLTVYALFFRNDSLLRVNVLVYFLPIVTMAATLLLTRRAVHTFDEVPGFGRLWGLMLMLGVSLGVAFALHRMHFGIFFLGPLAQLAVIAAAVFALLQYAAGRMQGKPDDRSPADVLRDAMRDRKP
jgi:hypothetical protein